MNNKSTSYLTHAIHPYHAKYIPDVPRYFINKYSNKGDRILDPFCGSGTTLLESIILERDSVGVDLSFLASKISRAKTFIIDSDKFKEFHDDFSLKYYQIKDYDKVNFPDKNIWYTEETNAVLDKLYYLIKNIDNEEYKCIYEVAFSSILKTVSNKGKPWNNGYIADNVLPYIDYQGDALKVFNNQIKKYIFRYKDLSISTQNLNKVSTKVYNTDILNYKSDKEFDLIVTSPPYPFAVDFVKYNRLSYYWFNVNINEYADKETGSRHKRSRKGAIDDFFDEMKKIYLHLFKMVKINGYFCMTVSDTHRNKKRIFFYDWLVELFTKNGWILIESNIREIESQSMAQKKISEEHMVVFKKVK